MSDTAGYSGTPLWKKLGLKPGMTAQVLHADAGWSIPLEGAPGELTWLPEATPRRRASCSRSTAPPPSIVAELDTLGERIRPDGMLWVAWPRKAAGHVSDLDENLIRDTALARGLVDVKVAAARHRLVRPQTRLASRATADPADRRVHELSVDSAVSAEFGCTRRLGARGGAGGVRRRGRAGGSRRAWRRRRRRTR